MLKNQPTKNQDRLPFIYQNFGAFILPNPNGCVKNPMAFKGWQIHLNPQNPNYTQLVKLNGGKGIIHQTGLLECLVVLKRLVRNLNTPVTINKPTPTQTVKQPTKQPKVK